MLSAVDTDTIKGIRDKAILLLLWGNALRRSELVNCNISDYDRASGELTITEALNQTNGDVRKVQKLSRHSNLNTLMIYIFN